MSCLFSPPTVKLNLAGEWNFKFLATSWVIQNFFLILITCYHVEIVISRFSSSFSRCSATENVESTKCNYDEFQRNENIRTKLVSHQAAAHLINRANLWALMSILWFHLNSLCDIFFAACFPTKLHQNWIFMSVRWKIRLLFVSLDVIQNKEP